MQPKYCAWHPNKSHMVTSHGLSPAITVACMSPKFCFQPIVYPFLLCTKSWVNLQAFEAKPYTFRFDFDDISLLGHDNLPSQLCSAPCALTQAPTACWRALNCSLTLCQSYWTNMTKSYLLLGSDNADSLCPLWSFWYLLQRIFALHWIWAPKIYLKC